jgi:hypothetical protein
LHEHLQKCKDSTRFVVSNDTLNVDVVAALVGYSYYLKRYNDYFKPALLFSKEEVEARADIMKLLNDLGIDLDCFAYKTDLPEQPEEWSICLLDNSNVYSGLFKRDAVGLVLDWDYLRMPFSSLVAKKLFREDLMTPVLAKLLAVPIYLMSNNFDDQFLGKTWLEGDKEDYAKLVESAGEDIEAYVKETILDSSF